MIKHRFNDIKQRTKLEDKDVISLTLLANKGVFVKGTEYDIKKMTYNEFETLYVNYPLFKSLIDFQNKVNLTKRRGRFGVFTKKTYELKHGPGYYNV